MNAITEFPMEAGRTRWVIYAIRWSAKKIRSAEKELMGPLPTHIAVAAPVEDTAHPLLLGKSHRDFLAWLVASHAALASSKPLTQVRLLASANEADLAAWAKAKPKLTAQNLPCRLVMLPETFPQAGGVQRCPSSWPTPRASAGTIPIKRGRTPLAKGA